MRWTPDAFDMTENAITPPSKALQSVTHAPSDGPQCPGLTQDAANSLDRPTTAPWRTPKPTRGEAAAVNDAPVAAAPRHAGSTQEEDTSASNTSVMQGDTSDDEHQLLTWGGGPIYK